MPEKDYLIFGKTVSYTGVFDMATFYKVMKKFYYDNGFIFSERQYRDLTEGLYCKWVAYKKMDDYVKKYIEMDIKTKNLQTIKQKTKTMNKGTVELEFKAYLEKDYEDNWLGGISRFTRAIFDVFIKKSAIQKYEEELKEDVDCAVQEAKAYLNVESTG